MKEDIVKLQTKNENLYNKYHGIISYTNQVENDYNLLKKTNTHQKLYIESLCTKIVGLVHKIENLNRIAVKHDEK